MLRSLCPPPLPHSFTPKEVGTPPHAALPLLSSPPLHLLLHEEGGITPLCAALQTGALLKAGLGKALTNTQDEVPVCVCVCMCACVYTHVSESDK